MWRTYWLCLSFANVVYLRAWHDLYPREGSELFFRKVVPGIHLYFAIASDVLALSLLTFLLVCLAPRLPGWLQRTLLVIAIAVAALALRSFISDSTGLLRSGLFRFLSPKVLFALAAFSGVMAAACMFRFFSRALRIAQFAAFSASPCLAVTFLGALFTTYNQAPLPSDAPLAARLPGSPQVRVVWMIFDEWDQRLTFSDRAPQIHLPVIDDLVHRSLFATHALAVESRKPVPKMATEDALPSLLYGKHLSHSVVKNAETRYIDFADGTHTIFGKGESIFARMRSRGWNSAIAGWYLPYCRVFSAELTDCHWDQIYNQESSASLSFANAAGDETRMLFETSMFSPFRTSLVALRHSGEYDAILAAAERDAADPSIGLTFVHFNIPHAPYFYNGPSGGKTRSGYSAVLYDRTLELVDASIGDMLASLKQAGLADKTAIILSSDHPARFPTRIDGGNDPHVPFIVHMPEEASGIVLEQEFSTIKTADLVLAITEGRVRTAADVNAWLQRMAETHSP